MPEKSTGLGDDHSEDEDLDDIDAYIATFDEQSRRDLSAAEAAIDKAILRHRMQEMRGQGRVDNHFGTVTPEDASEEGVSP